MLKFLKDLNFLVDNKMFELEKKATRAISKLDGFLLGSSFKNLFNQILILKEIVNNNDIEGIHSTYLNLLYTINELGPNNNDELITFYNLEAFNYGTNFIYENGYINKRLLIKIQQIIRNNSEGIRKIFGTVIKNSKNEVIHTPPQSFEKINQYLDELEKFINDSTEFTNLSNLPPLMKLAIIHYQFEAIHPFNDGNGRTGRILNILYLILKKEIENPVFALSYYINQNKQKYYLFLNAIHQDDNELNNLIEYMLKGIEQSSNEGIQILKDLLKINQKINELSFPFKINYQQKLTMFNRLLFSTEWFAKLLDISLNTARKYLKLLVEFHILIEVKKGNRKRYGFSHLINYINQMD